MSHLSSNLCALMSAFTNESCVKKYDCGAVSVISYFACSPCFCCRESCFFTHCLSFNHLSMVGWIQGELICGLVIIIHYDFDLFYFSFFFQVWTAFFSWLLDHTEIPLSCFQFFLAFVCVFHDAPGPCNMFPLSVLVWTCFFSCF